MKIWVLHPNYEGKVVAEAYAGVNHKSRCQNDENMTVQKGATVDHCNKSILQRHASHVQEGCEVSEAHQLFGPSGRSSELLSPVGSLLPHSNSPHGGNHSHDGQFYFISVWKSNIESPGRGVQWKGTKISLYKE